MKDNRIRIFALMIVLIGSLFFSIGCQQEVSDEQTIDSEELQDEEVVVKFSYPPHGYDTSKVDAFWERNIEEFENQYPNIKIEMTVESWDTVYTKWEQMFESGDTADIGMASPSSIARYGSQGRLLPVSDIINELGGEEALVSSMHHYKVDGEWYAVPQGDDTYVLAFRRDILEDVGYDEPPGNWEELTEVAVAATGEGIHGLGMFLGDTRLTEQILTGLIKSAGGRILDEEGNADVNTPENLEALTFMTDLYLNQQAIPSSARDWQYGDDANALATGKIAMSYTWGGFATLFEDMFPDDYDKIGYTKLPDGPSGVSGSWSGTAGFFIFKDANHPDEAKEFIKYMSRPELRKEWCLVAGNVSPFLDTANDPELLEFEWYKAMMEQSPTQVHIGWDYGIYPELRPHVRQAVIDVIEHGKTPEEALEIMEVEINNTMNNILDR